jgi:hypothetical protein
MKVGVVVLYFWSLRGGGDERPHIRQQHTKAVFA